MKHLDLDPAARRRSGLQPPSSRIVTLSLLMTVCVALSALPAAASTCVADGTGCCTEPFDAVLDPAWTLDALGDAGGVFAETTGGSLQLSGTGSTLYHGPDNGAFLHQTVAGEFRIEIDITDVPVESDATYGKGGLMVRSSTAPDAARMMIQYVPSYPDPQQPGAAALLFDVRASNGGMPIALSSTVVGIQLPVRVAIQRRLNEFQAYYSTDAGATWIRPLGGHSGRIQMSVGSLGSNMLAGVALASYDDDAMTMSFDDVSFCKPAAVAPVPTAQACQVDESRDYLYLLDVSGSMIRPHGALANGETKLDSALSALSLLNDTIAAQDDGSRAALMVYSGDDDVANNLASGARVISSFTDDFDLLAASIQAQANIGVSSQDSSPAAIAWNEALTLLQADRDDDHGAVVVWATDNLGNIDAAGEGPAIYTDSEIQSISVVDGFGDFLPPATVAWKGDFNIAVGAFDGRPIGDAMKGIVELRDDQLDARVFSLMLQGDGIDTPILNDGLPKFAAFYTEGEVFSPTSTAQAVSSVADLLTAIDCEQPGPAVVRGHVWEDVNSDGVRETSEPGIAGVMVSNGSSSDVTDADGAYRLEVAPGANTISVSVAGLTPTTDSDGVGTPNQATVALNTWQVASAFDFGYFDPASVQIGGCFDDDFANSALDASWNVASLGDADQVSVVESGGTLKVESDGISAYAGADHGAFLYRRVAGNFRMEVDIEGFPQETGGAYLKAGLMVRAGLDELAKRLMIQYVPDFAGNGPALQFRYRATQGGVGDKALGSNLYGITLPVRLAIQRTSNLYLVEFSNDGGATWTQPSGGTGGVVNLAFGSDTLVGLNAVSYDSNVTLITEFDDFSTCVNP